MRNLFRVLTFDIAVPLLTLVALVLLGIFLDWPLWWVSVCSMLGLLIVQAAVLNVVLYRRDAVTMGTDDDGPGLRLAAVAVMTAALVTAVAVGYTQQTVPERRLGADSAEVVRIATEVSEATATFSPQTPDLSINRAAEMMAPEQAEAFKANFGKSTEELARKNISARAQTISAGVEALGPTAASVAVVLRATQEAPRQEPSRAVLTLRVALVKKDGRWLVADVVPINPPPAG